MIYEDVVAFQCNNLQLHGIASIPVEPRCTRGVIILVGGPQYRAGSHRQFTLLARELAAHGIPVFRFDYRGMGDSEGQLRDFQDLDDDLRAAVDAFAAAVPVVQEYVIWGLCDAAAAAAFYAYQDSRICGLVLLNPWVRTEQGIAKTYLKRYYLQRLAEPAFWSKVVKGRFNYIEAGQSMATSIRDVFFKTGATVKTDTQVHTKAVTSSPSLPDRVLDGLSRFKGKILIILSANDLTAQEFEEVAKSTRKWKRLMSSQQLVQHKLPHANHTFSRREWRDQVANWTKDWLHRW